MGTPISIDVHEISEEINSCLTIFMPANFKHILHGIPFLLLLFSKSFCLYYPFDFYYCYFSIKHLYQMAMSPFKDSSFHVRSDLESQLFLLTTTTATTINFISRE